MEYEIIEKERMKLAGFDYRGSMLDEKESFEKKIENLWGTLSEFCVNKWLSIDDEVVDPKYSYEVQVWNEEELDQEGKLEVFVGFELEDIDEIPVELVNKVLPATKYISFQLKGEEIETWEEDILQDWIPDSDYWIRSFDEYLFHIQCFHEEKYKGIDNIEDSELEVLIPVEKVDEELKEE